MHSCGVFDDINAELKIHDEQTYYSFIIDVHDVLSIHEYVDVVNKDNAYVVESQYLE